MLIDATDAPNMNSCIPDEHKDTFEMACRRGLSAPSEYCFALRTLATEYYTAMAWRCHVVVVLFRAS